MACRAGDAGCRRAPAATIVGEGDQYTRAVGNPCGETPGGRASGRPLEAVPDRSLGAASESCTPIEDSIEIPRAIPTGIPIESAIAD